MTFQANLSVDFNPHYKLEIFEAYHVCTANPRKEVKEKGGRESQQGKQIQNQPVTLHGWVSCMYLVLHMLV